MCNLNWGDAATWPSNCRPTKIIINNYAIYGGYKLQLLLATVIAVLNEFIAYANFYTA